MKYLVFADGHHQPAGGAHDFVTSHDAPFDALAELIEHDTGHIAEFDGDDLTVVAERTGPDLKLYPERMAHQRRAAQAARDAGGEHG